MSLRLHGDVLAPPGMRDFAVNVWPGPRPAGLEEALERALAGGHRYPDEREAVQAIAARHGRAPGEVLLTNGACEAFWLPAMRPRRAACIHPAFTEPEAALRAAGVEVVRVPRQPEGWRLDPAAVPGDADHVVLGNPNNPTGALDPREAIMALARPGRLVVVDESFMDFVPDERESLAGWADVPGLVVVRSLTKLWGLAGIRAGYLLAEPGVVAALAAGRQPWSVNALACAALRWCAADRATPAAVAAEVAAARARLARDLGALGVRVWPSEANFLLIEVPDGAGVVRRLRARGVAVRPAAGFPGLGAGHLRVAVRPPEENAFLVAALREALP